MRPSAKVDIQIEGPDEVERKLLDALDGKHTREELSGEFGKLEVNSVLSRLEELNVVEDAADEDLIPADVIERFDRQLRYFSDVTMGPLPSQCQASLENARIAVLGVGGLGGGSALALACCGIGEMLLVDFDRVELSNLNRQVLYGESDVGRLKVEAAAERLAAFSSRIRLETMATRLEGEAEIVAAIEGYDLVIDAIDWPAHDVERWINSACFAAGIPYIAMSHFPPVARIGPLYVPGETGCFACQEIAFKRLYPLFDVATDQLRSKSSPAATLGPACGLIGNAVALDVMHFLTGLAEPATLGAALMFDLRTMEVQREPVPLESQCPICAARQTPQGDVVAFAKRRSEND